ncbi:hypothetical protein [Streptomyces sp. CB02923]|uniref:hypothetical protein n=1 Tax=Streptomyces sp. CB02923 TaxID=1718985 RepID=UPI0019007A19|nr:hypothetical protein [Streptomyces sp. CB02923]
MITKGRVIAMAGAAGQQGGAVDRPLPTDGRSARAANTADSASLGAAIEGTYRRFSLQPDPGSPALPPEYD